MHRILTFMEYMNTRDKFLAAQQKADELSKVLFYYPRFKMDAVQIVHNDGSNIFLHDAFYFNYGEFVLVFSEHNGHMVFWLEDLHVIRAFATVNEVPELTKSIEHKLRHEREIYDADQNEWKKQLDEGAFDEIE